MKHINLRFIFIAFLVVLFATSLAQSQQNGPGSNASYFSRSPAPSPWLALAAADWMARLPDSAPLHKMSIPGTHDSAALHGGLFVQTQSWSITEQLNAGVRYLDIRTRRTTGQGIHALAIHHGIVFQQIWFDQIMNEVTAFLQRHPEEVIIMRVKGDEFSPKRHSKSYAEIWPAYLAAYGEYFANVDDPLPTLGELRGKIYIVNDGADLFHQGTNWQNSEMILQDYYTVWGLWFRLLKGHHASLVSKKAIVNLFMDMAGARDNGKWVFNHLSGSGGMVPRDVAKAVNKSAFQHIQKASRERTFGTVIMDFPGENLIYDIINSNF